MLTPAQSLKIARIARAAGIPTKDLPNLSPWDSTLSGIKIDLLRDQITQQDPALASELMREAGFDQGMSLELAAAMEENRVLGIPIPEHLKPELDARDPLAAAQRRQEAEEALMKKWEEETLAMRQSRNPVEEAQAMEEARQASYVAMQRSRFYKTAYGNE